jgi:hypothetical protein
VHYTAAPPRSRRRLPGGATWRQARLGLLTLLFVAAAAPVRADEIIRSFEADVRLRKDTSLDVTETIVMDFGNAQKHGIYRIIPVRYDRHGGSYTTYLKLESITDGNGAPWRYTSSRQGRDINIRIGDPDRTITGVHTYRIRYGSGAP